jgi:hypothetical protein
MSLALLICQLSSIFFTMFGILLIVVFSSVLPLRLCFLHFQMLMGLAVWMTAPEALASSLQFPGQILSLSIRLLLMLPQSGFSLYYMSLALNKCNLHCYGVKTLERRTSLRSQFSMKRQSILKWILTLSENMWVKSSFKFGSFCQRIKLLLIFLLNLLLPLYEHCKCNLNLLSFKIEGRC